MERAANKAERLLRLEQLLLAFPEGLHKAEIARRLGVHRSTVGRDVTDLSSRITIWEDENLVGIDRDDYKMDVRLTLHESMALHLAARLMATRSDKHNPHAAAALRKLGEALRKLAPLVSQHLLASAEVMDGQAQRHDPVYLQVLETLTRAWSDRRKVRLWHRMEDGRVFEYTFAPYFIEPYAVGQTTHAIGWREPPGAQRTFKVERIQRAELTDQPYAIPETFDPHKLLADAWGIWYTESEPVEVLLRFHPRVAQRVKETQWHRSEQVVEQADGTLLWKAWVAEPQEMLPWIRGWGADVEVIEPEGLRERMMGEIKRMAASYKLADIKPPPLYQLLWAKTSRDRTRTHSLVYHMLDVAQVVAALWDRSLPEATRRYFSTMMHMDQPSARRWFAFVAGLHDLGKACPAFQSLYLPGKQILAERGLSFDEQRVRVKTPHGLVSTLTVRDLLKQQLGLDRYIAQPIAQTIGAHHGVFPTSFDLQQIGPGQRGEQDWDAVRRDLFACLAVQFGVSDLASWPDGLDEIPAFWTLLSGLISFADWIGSIESYFFDLQAPNLDAYAKTAYQTAVQALDQLGWTGWSPPVETMDFRTLFDGYTPRPLQQAAIDVASRLSAPALVVIESPTGEGKTEAALYLADRWLQAEQQRGTYIAMPTQATSNQMMHRMRTFLEHRYAQGSLDLLLLHGDAIWSDEMEELRMAAIGDDAQSTVMAHGWFLQNKKRGLLAPFAVGTVDQALMSILQTRHFFVRLYGLSHKTVILDEVHAYDTYMSTLLERLLQWLSAMGTTVVILSATLPAKTRQALFKAYTGREFAHHAPYPALSWASAQADGVMPLETSALNTRNLALGWIDRAPEALAETLRARLADGGCAAVICNTVGRAQAVYQALHDARLVSDDDLILFHARFPFNRRQTIEQDVLERFGKDGQRPARAIVVATQVIEQSLDLDFDLMISDLAPADLILQRAGRLHRHRRQTRPPGLAEPRLWITRPEIKDDVPRWRNDGYVYEPYVLIRSYLALQGREDINVPGDVQGLIEDVYGQAEPEPAAPALQAAMVGARNKMEAGMREERFKARSNLIPKPDDETVLSSSNRDLDEDNPELHDTWRAMTRLVRPSVTLVCLHRQRGAASSDEVSLDQQTGGQSFALGDAPNRELGRELAQRTVTVSSYAVVKHFLAQDPPAGWRDHPSLRYHRAVVFEDGRYDYGDGWLILDDRLGLLVQRKEGV